MWNEVYKGQRAAERKHPTVSRIARVKVYGQGWGWGENSAMHYFELVGHIWLYGDSAPWRDGREKCHFNSIDTYGEQIWTTKFKHGVFVKPITK